MTRPTSRLQCEPHLAHTTTDVHEILPYSVDTKEHKATRDGKYAVTGVYGDSVVTPEDLAQYARRTFYTGWVLSITDMGRYAMSDVSGRPPLSAEMTPRARFRQRP